MIVFVNDQKIETLEHVCIDMLLKNLKLNHQGGTAVAVNNKVIPKDQWNVCELNENDRILVIKASQGG